MAFFDLMEYGTVMYGVFAACFSAYYAVYFARSPKNIGKSVSLVLAAESFGLWITVIFSLGAGVWRWIGPEQEMAMRWLLFSSANFSSMHLKISLARIHEGID